jgi:hypothetical protein
MVVWLVVALWVSALVMLGVVLNWLLDSVIIFKLPKTKVKNKEECLPLLPRVKNCRQQSSYKGSAAKRYGGAKFCTTIRTIKD